MIELTKTAIVSLVAFDAREYGILSANGEGNVDGYGNGRKM